MSWVLSCKCQDCGNICCGVLAGAGVEPYAAPPGVPVRVEVQPRKQHPAFQDPGQDSIEAKSATGSDAPSQHQTVDMIEAG